MYRKGRVVGAGLLAVGMSWSVVAARAEVQPCGEVLARYCIGCHEADRFCERLGGGEKEWRALLKRMVANGAELEKGDLEPLAACLSEPAEGARKVCGK